MFFLGSETAAWNRKSLATFHRTLKSQCSIACSCLGNRCDFWGPQIEESYMGVDAKWGRFPTCPEISRFVPVCPLLSFFRAELKVTHLRWQSPISGFLRFSAKIFGFLQKSAVFCGFLRPTNAGISRRRGESAKICGFLRKSAFWVPSVSSVPLSAPRFLGPRTGTNRDQRGQTGTKREISGQIGKRPRLASTPIELSSSDGHANRKLQKSRRFRCAQSGNFFKFEK